MYQSMCVCVCVCDFQGEGQIELTWSRTKTYEVSHHGVVVMMQGQWIRKAVCARRVRPRLFSNTVSMEEWAGAEEKRLWMLPLRITPALMNSLQAQWTGLDRFQPDKPILLSHSRALSQGIMI